MALAQHFLSITAWVLEHTAPSLGLSGSVVQKWAGSRLGVCELPTWQGSESRRESVHGGLSETSMFQTLSPPRQAVRSTGIGVMLGLLSKVKSKNLVPDPIPVILANAGIHFDLRAVSTSHYPD
ncbi:hypothetical protein GCM10007418_01550 [Halopseudomonas salina]|uniref:Uncharacterized protein n=1 Tax=Halopseudomonas salina TaxID=1323744 RepID=A0ABQ1NUZ9_9GAMM|nr:hypothetical protein GCM10007418_01550 [Halopseudomonas salina]